MNGAKKKGPGTKVGAPGQLAHRDALAGTGVRPECGTANPSDPHLSGFVGCHGWLRGTARYRGSGVGGRRHRRGGCVRERLCGARWVVHCQTIPHKLQISDIHLLNAFLYAFVKVRATFLTFIWCRVTPRLAQTLATDALGLPKRSPVLALPARGKRIPVPFVGFVEMFFLFTPHPTVCCSWAWRMLVVIATNITSIRLEVAHLICRPVLIDLNTNGFQDCLFQAASVALFWIARVHAFESELDVARAIPCILVGEARVVLWHYMVR